MHSVFDLLDHEWRHLSDNRRAARQLRQICTLADDAPTLGDLEHHVRAATPEDADTVLLALVRRVIEHDDALAARVLLQLLLPGTRNLARRWWALGDHDERAAAAVTAVYNRIRTYPLTQRPGRIAANILLDAARELRRTIPRLITTPTPDPTTHTDRQTPPTTDHAAIELADILTDAVHNGLIELRDAQLIAASRIAGQRIADIATHHHLGTRALWDRRQRAEHKLTTAHAS